MQVLEDNELRYAQLQRIAREHIASKINAKNARVGVTRFNGVTLASICDAALEEARKEWPKYYGPDTHDGFQHSWERLYYKFRHRVSFFNLAVWQEIEGQGRVLQGLALGKPSNSKTHLTVHWVERSFAPTAIRGALTLILPCALEYAKLLRAKRVLIKDPVDSRVYEKYGFTPYKLPKVGGVYMSRKVL
ncbi:MAG: hypothetical protein ACXIVD_11725 [Salinarimonas sp.]